MCNVQWDGQNVAVVWPDQEWIERMKSFGEAVANGPHSLTPQSTRAHPFLLDG